MKAITIHQPWSSLIAVGAKRFETRGWKTNYRGPVAIHAGKKVDHQAVMMLARKYPEIWRKISPLPTGCIIAAAELVECWKWDGEHGILIRCDQLFGTYGINWITIDEQEMNFGYYDHGRYAWEMTNVRQIAPIPARGQQGLWNWEEPNND